MSNFDLDKFLANYKPKKEPNLGPYLRMKTLKHYKLMKNKEQLIPEKMYIKYIKEGNMMLDDKYDDRVIEDGGMLVSGGHFINGEFVETNNKSDWTHLKLRTDISKKTKNYQRYYSYYIKIISYVIFYKSYASNDSREFMMNLLREL